MAALGQGDDLTFGPGSNNTSWDQFTANEQMFGITTSFDEDLYTTKLNRNTADFKERERKAQRIANEIIGVGHTQFIGINFDLMQLPPRLRRLTRTSRRRET